MCPICGAEERLGVYLPHKKVRVFDIIARSGSEGISGDALAELLNTNRINAKQHVYGLNDFLAEVGYAVRGEPGSHWSKFRLVKSG